MSLFALKLTLVVAIPFALYGLYILYGKYKLSSQWRISESSVFTEKDISILTDKFHPYSFLTESEQKELHRKIKFFLQTKNINPVGDLIVTHEMKLLVAAEACLLIINASSEVFPGLNNIFLMEDTFIQKNNPVNHHTGLQSDVPKLGQAFKRGPIILSWTAVQDGLKNPHGRDNVVYHEFSHNLDQQDGSFDGTPELGPAGNYKRWSDVMGRKFLNLRKDVSSNRGSDIDSYGATNEAEFFSVMTEYYFNRPRALQKKHPKVYEIYNAYFKLDPVRWDS